MAVSEIFERWLKPSHVRLHAGEMGAQEMRSVLAVVRLLQAEVTAALSDQVVVRPLSEWHEDMGPMLWWCWEPPKPFEQISERVVSSAHDGQWLGEAPYVGGPNDSDWPDYHTHFTPIPHPSVPASTPVRSS